MREFAKKGSRLEGLSTEAKIVYTGFVVFSLVGLFVSVALYSSLLGGDVLDGARQYYAGEEVPYEPVADESVAGPAIAMPGDGAGPAIALPGEGEGEPAIAMPDEGVGGPVIAMPDGELDDQPILAAAGPMVVSTTPRKMLEVTHFHLFTMPIFLLVIGHLFMMCAASAFTKTFMLLSSMLATATHIGAPWIIFLAGSSWAWLMPVTGSWMMASMVVLLLKPTWDMWKPSKKRHHKGAGALAAAAQQMPREN